MDDDDLSAARGVLLGAFIGACIIGVLALAFFA